MNIVDVGILIVLLASAAFGYYRGSIAALLGLAGGLVALLLSLAFAPSLAAALGGNRGVTELLATYTDAESMVGDYALATTAVDGIGDSAVQAILKSVALPASLADILRSNLTSGAFAAAGLVTVNQYVSNTIVTAVLQAASFVVCFFVICFAVHFVVNMLNHMLRFPVLKHFDGLAGGLLGLLRGMLFAYVLFLLAPLIKTIVPVPLVTQLFDASSLGGLFASDGFFTRVVTGR